MDRKEVNMRKREPMTSLGVLEGEEGALVREAWVKRKAQLEEDHPMGHPRSEQARHTVGVRGLPREADEPRRYEVYMDSEEPEAVEELASFLGEMSRKEYLEEKTRAALSKMRGEVKAAETAAE